MGKVLGVNTVLNKSYPVFELSPQWLRHLGRISRNFKMLIYGDPGNGKTSYTMQLCKELARHGKVFYNSKEEGDSSTIQDAFKAHRMDQVAGKFMLGDRFSFDEMLDKVRKGGYKFIVVDSIDYMNFTTTQYKQLIETFPKKAFIFISWEKNGKPKLQAAKDIEYMADIKVHVLDFMAYARSRFGSLEDYVIWPEKVKELRKRNLNLTDGQLKLFDNVATHS